MRFICCQCGDEGVGYDENGDYLCADCFLEREIEEIIKEMDDGYDKRQ